MKQRRIGVSLFSYRKSYYLTHPWKFFHELKVGIKNYWARMTKGYAWIDLWNFDMYLAEMLPNALEELAEKSCGWPGRDPWPEFEDWTADLHTLTKLMRLLQYEYCDPKFDNGFREWRGRTLIADVQDKKFYNEYLLSEEDVAHIDATANEYEKAAIMREALKKVVFHNFMRLYDTLWD